MKVLLVLCLLLAPAVAAPSPFQVSAKIVALPNQIIACGRIAFKAVVRYEVISVDQGTYDTKQLFVVELCPEHRKLGETRKLKLRPVTRNASFVDDFKATPGSRWAHVE